MKQNEIGYFIPNFKETRISFSSIYLYRNHKLHLIFKSDTVLSGDFIDRMMSDLPFVQPTAWWVLNPPVHPIAREMRTNPFLIYGGTWRS